MTRDQEMLALADRIAAWMPSYGLLLFIARERRLIEDALRAAIQPQRALEAAAEHVCWFDWSSNDTDAVDAIEGLRKALAHTRPKLCPTEKIEDGQP